MTLQSNLPSDKRRPGTFHSFDDFSGARGLVPLQRRIALLGAISASGEGTADVPEQAFSEADADRIAGRGTLLALMARKCFEVFRLLGTPAQVWLCPVADPDGTAAARTLTVTVDGSQAGDVEFRIAGRPLRASVAAGDTANTIASKILDAIDGKLTILPVTAAVGDGGNAHIVTATATVTGVDANDIVVEVDKAPAGVTVTVNNSAVAGVGVLDYEDALEALGSRHYFSVAIQSHAQDQIDELVDHMDEMWAPGKKRYRHGFVALTASLATATTRAGATNDKRICLSTFEGARSLPGEIAAAVGAMRLTRERPAANYSRTELPLFLPDDGDVYIDSEVETALAGGTTPLTVTDTGRALVERLVTTKTTEASVPFENLLDLANSWTLAFYALQADARLSVAWRFRNLDEELLDESADIVYGVLLEGQALGDLHKVEEHKDEIRISPHPGVPTRALLEIPQSVVPGAQQLDATHRLFVEGAGEGV